MDITTPVRRKPIREAAAIQPTAQESPFEFDELFFSVTDQSSRILQANDVFVRISKYEEHEIIGALHKLIRHPDMPRAVFDIF